MEELLTYEMVSCPQEEGYFPVLECSGCLHFKGETIRGIKCHYDDYQENKEAGK